MDRTPEPNWVAAKSSTVSSSPTVQESPFSNFVSNLSPIDTMKRVSCTQGLFGTNLPTSPVVFTSPHINLQRQTSFLERDDTVEVGLDVYKECNTTLVQIQNPRFEDVQLCSPSGCVDEFLADPVEAGCANFADLHLQPTNEVPRVSHSGLISCKESNTEVHDVTFGSTPNKALMLSDQAEEDRPLCSIERSEAAINQRDGKAKEEFLRFTFEKSKESGTNADLVSGAQHCGETATKLQRSGCLYDEQNASSQSYEYSKARRTIVLKGSVKEGAQNQCGIRRHLQFEASKAYKLTIPTNSKNPASSHFHNKASSCPQAISPDPSQFPSCPYESVTSAQIGVNSAPAAPIHSGIGLHLNHIATSTSMTSDIFSSKKPTGYLTTPEQHSNSNNIAMNSSSTLASPVCGIFYSHVASGQHESQAVTEASSFNFHSMETIKPLFDTRHLMLVDQEADPCGAGMSPSQDTDTVDELNQLSHKRKRKKEAYTSEACKRCNCRRSKCLKLYCECFSAGVYCLDSCACQNCYNKLEFEDTVIEIRQQIESRNPLAFTPKVVDNAIDSSVNSTEDQNLTTPSSARHKRGCNCKKSKCLKKYCECYQAKVGCSDGCRCEGCQNTFGTMAVYNGAKRWEPHPTAKLAASINQNSPTFEVLSDISNLTPLTNPTSRPLTSSASSSRRNSWKIPQAQLPSSQHPSDTGRLNWGCPPVIVTQQLPEGKLPRVLSSAGARHDMTDDDTPEILRETSYPSKVVKVSSPNKKCVSPPQSRSRLRSSSPTGLRSGRKFIFHAVPSFPPLTPYHTSKEDTSEIGNDDEATNKNNWNEA